MELLNGISFIFESKWLCLLHESQLLLNPLLHLLVWLSNSQGKGLRVRAAIAVPREEDGLFALVCRGSKSQPDVEGSFYLDPAYWAPLVVYFGYRIGDSIHFIFFFSGAGPLPVLCVLIFFNIYIWPNKSVLNPFLLILSSSLLRHVDYPAPTSNLFQSATTTLTSPTWCFGPSSGCNHIVGLVLRFLVQLWISTPIRIKVMATIS